MKCQLYLGELDRIHLGWSLAWWQEWGLFLLKCLFCTTSAMKKREQQHFRWRDPHQATAAGDTAPMQPSVWILLGYMKEDILKVAEDIYHGQFQLALSILTCWHHDLLMQDLHNQLDQWKVRTGLCGASQTAPWCWQSATCSGRSQSWGRAPFHAHPWAPSSSQAQPPSQQTNRHEGTTAQQWCGCSTVHSSWAQSTCTTNSQKHLSAPLRVDSQTPAHSPSRHEHSHRRDESPLHSWVSSVVVIPPAHTQAPASNSNERTHQWGALAPHIGVHTAGVDSNSSIRACHRGVQHRVRCMPGLPQGAPPGVSHLC